jgi:hypothetical protein
MILMVQPPRRGEGGDVAIASTAQGDPAREVSPEAVAALRGVFRGDLIGVGDPGYENARRV